MHIESSHVYLGGKDVKVGCTIRKKKRKEADQNKPCTTLVSKPIKREEGKRDKDTVQRDWQKLLYLTSLTSIHNWRNICCRSMWFPIHEKDHDVENEAWKQCTNSKRERWTEIKHDSNTMACGGIIKWVWKG